MQDANSCVTSAEAESNDREIRVFRKRLFMFLFTPVLLYLPWLPIALLYGTEIFERAQGPNPETQIHHGFKYALERDYDMVFLGNSRTYRGLNPDRFAVPAFNFACDNDSFNQMYYKLQWLRRNDKRFSSVVLGVDLFQFSFFADNRNFIYGPYLGEEYLADFTPKPLEAEQRWVRKFLRSLNPKYVFLADGGKTFLRENGQFIKPGTAKSTDGVVRSTERLPLQVDYFERILADCREHGTQVFLCMLPIRVEEQKAYQEGEIEAFMDYVRSFTSDSVTLLDYTYDGGYVMSDYTDITHLNEAAAERMSVQVNGSVMALLNSNQDRSSIASDKSKKRVDVKPVSLRETSKF